MPDVEDVRLAYELRVRQMSDLHEMIALPRSSHQFALMIQDVVGKLHLTCSHDLLDVGCGNADFLRNLSPYAHSETGIDLSISLLTVGKQLLPQARFACAEAICLPFSGSSFHRVLSYSTFMHFPDLPYAFDVIRDLCRVSHNQGIVLIGDIPDRCLRRKVISRRWHTRYRLEVLLRWHPGPSIFNPLRWQFYDMESLKHFVESLGHRAEILSQPEDLLCASHRKDLLIHIRK